MDIIARIKDVAHPARQIPKPEATAPFLVKAWGKRRGENALVYTIPNNSGGRAYEKGVTEGELRRAHDELTKSGELTRSWFNANLAGCASEGACNFTTIGGLFCLIGDAQYDKRGRYVKL